MRPRQEGRRTSLEVRALYSLGELTRAAHVDIDRIRRLLRANGVRFVRAGRALLVPLSEIERKIPALWDSLLAAERLRRAADGRGSRTPRTS
jgi:hypothetical protein